jgi:hypothetical protein
MSDIVLLDTSVYLNVLDIPGYNQARHAVLQDFETKVLQEDYFLLPMATIWETGNHIAKLATGGLRFQFGRKLVDDVMNAINGVAPYRPTHFPSREEFCVWLNDFPNYVKRNKSPQRTNEGTSLSDLSIIKEWESTRTLHNLSRVLVWSLDADLAGYDSGAGG